MERPATLSVATTTLASPWGPVVVTATAEGILAVDLRREPAAMRRDLEARLGQAVKLVPSGAGRAAAVLARATVALTAALDGRPVDLATVPLDWSGVKAWDRRVLEGARGLRRSQVTGYGRLARRIGAPGAARAVGAAMSRNPFWLLVPCHRVVAGDGTLGGYGDLPDALEIKRDLLALEGVALPVVRLVD